MTHYVDGFVLPIPREHLDNYRRLVEEVAVIWKEHGALDYREYLGDDLGMEGVRSFTDATGAAEGDAIIFGWVEFESKEARDSANEKVASDPRMQELMGATETGFDAERMAYGGFNLFVRQNRDHD